MIVYNLGHTYCFHTQVPDGVTETQMAPTQAVFWLGSKSGSMTQAWHPSTSHLCPECTLPSPLLEDWQVWGGNSAKQFTAVAHSGGRGLLLATHSA
jgi:hypothetical protein